MSMFDGAVAIITGAAAGMGRAHALLLAERGATVVVQDIVGDRVEETAEMVRQKGGTAKAITCDIADVEAVAAKFRAVGRDLGRIDILVNNAGIGGEPVIEETTEAHFDRMFGVHVKGSFFATKAVVPFMKERRHGRIINISSMWAMTGFHHASPYIGAKAALMGFTRAWAKELAPWNILVNAIAPGGVVTEMVLQQPGIQEDLPRRFARVPLQRYAEPIEISYTVAFLASKESAFITGQLISPNGGQAIVGM